MRMSQGEESIHGEAIGKEHGDSSLDSETIAQREVGGKNSQQIRSGWREENGYR